MAVGALLVPPLIALIGTPLASADPADITTLGPYSFDGYTETLNINDATFGIDNYLVSPTPELDVDLFYGSTSSYGLLVTDPGVFQIGYDDIGGVPTFIDSFTPADFVPADLGLSEIGGGGVVTAEALAGLF